MGDYIGDRGSKNGGRQNRSSGQRVPDETKMFNIPPAGSSDRKKSADSGRPSGSAPSSKSSSASRSSAQRNAAPKSSSTRKNSSPSKSSSSKDAPAKSGPSRSSSSQSRNAASKSAPSKSAPSKGSTASKSVPSRSGGSAKSNAPKKNDNMKNSRKSGNSSFSDTLAAKRNSEAERALHSSSEAKKIKQDRSKREYQSRRKLFSFMYYAAIFIAVMAVIILMSVTVLFGIEDIEVIADSGVPYTSKQIVSACDIECGQNLFTAPVEEAGEQIMSNLPYIEECTVSRKLPSTVVITATAAQPVGIIRDADGGCIVLSSGLRALENVVSPGDAPGIPMVEGVIVDSVSEGEIVTTANPAHIEIVAQITEKLAEKGLTVDSIAFTPGGNITAVYDGRITFKFGTSVKLDEKLELAAVLINEGKITKHETGDLDLSISGRATFTPDYVKQQYAPKNEELPE